MVEGALEKLTACPGDPAVFQLRLRRTEDGDARAADAAPLLQMDLNLLVGEPIEIEYLGRISCCHCGRPTRKSFAQGYCYPCFRSLARCDLCVVSPDRCHFAAGTCREPDWGAAFCMQPHLVYLANSSGPKVGITRQGQEQGRWLDQGATQGLVILRAPSRHLAGLAERAIARNLSDRTDWRALVREDAPPVDLHDLRNRLREAALDLPAGMDWAEETAECRMHYPVLRYPSRIHRFRLDRDRQVGGRLLGIKGQFLLFEDGVLNMRQHRSFHIRFASTGAVPQSRPGAQMELFSA